MDARCQAVSRKWKASGGGGSWRARAAGMFTGVGGMDGEGNALL